jgi:molybdopterin converting factor small subunit
VGYSEQKFVVGKDALEFEISTNVLNDFLGLRRKIEIPQKDSITLRELFALWASRYGREISERFIQEGAIRPEVILLVNEKNIDSLQGLDTEIHDRDKLVILTAVAGG